MLAGSIQSALPTASKKMKLLAIDALDSQIENIRLMEESCDEFVRSKQEEVAARDKRARRWVKATDFAGRSVLPICFGSLIGTGFNPLFWLGIPVSISVLAVAFCFRNSLYKENARLLKAGRELDDLQNLKSRLIREKVPLERQKKELEWIKKAAQIARDLDKEKSIAVDDDFIVIGGIKLKREKEERT